MTPILAALLMARTASDVTLDFTSPRGLIVAQIAGNGGRPMRLLVDTGAQRSVVDSAMAKALGLTLGETTRVRGAGGAVDARLVGGLRLEGLSEGLEAVALPLDALSGSIGVHLDGIMGQDILSQHVVEVDREAGKLTFGTRPPAVSSGDTVVSLHLRRGRPYLMATVVDPNGGLSDAELLLDTGSDTTAELAQPYADEVGLRTHPDPNGRSILGVGGLATLRVPDLRELRVGGASLSAEDVRVFARMTDSVSDGDGRVGGGFLSRFRVTIDGPGLKLVLTPLRKP